MAGDGRTRTRLGGRPGRADGPRGQRRTGVDEPVEKQVESVFEGSDLSTLGLELERGVTHYRMGPRRFYAECLAYLYRRLVRVELVAPPGHTPRQPFLELQARLEKLEARVAEREAGDVHLQ